MVDARLYLPNDWCESPERCDEAGIPEDKRQFKTKLELAKGIIEHQASLGVSFDFISADGYYGNDASLAYSVDKMGYLYMFDIHKDQTIFMEKPDIVMSASEIYKGTIPKKVELNMEGIRVDQYINTIEDDDWQNLTVRNTAKGKLKGQYHFAKVYILNKTLKQIEDRLLVIRKTKSTNQTIEIKYSFTNANLEQYTAECIAYMQAQRFFVEHSIKESKQILGLDEFQTRRWLAWEHQVALNFIVAAFMLKEKLFCFNDLPLLSARDIKDYLSFKLYKQLSDDDMVNLIYSRHLKRRLDINKNYLTG